MPSQLSLSIALCTALLFAVAQAQDEPPVPVVAKPLAQLLKPQVYSAPATVKPLNRPQLAAEVTGRVLNIPVKTGSSVQAGDLLVELDCDIHQLREQSAGAAVRRAQAQLAFARAQLKRAENLKAKRTISDELFEQRRTEVATANTDLQARRSDLAQAQINVGHCRITAPFDALVSKRLSSVGSLANPGTPLLELVQTSSLEVSAELRDHQAERLREAISPQFEYLGKRYPLSLRSLPPLIDERTRTREARLHFGAATAPVGAAGRLIWESSQQQLPAQFLVRRDARLGIFVAEGSHARFVALSGAREGQPAIVNLSPDTLLITEGRQRLNDGTPIATGTAQ